MPPSLDFQQVIFSSLLWSCTGSMMAIFRVKNFQDFLRTTIIKLSFFHSIETTKKISSLSHGAYVFRVVLCEWLELFARRFVPVFPPNLDDATDSNHFLWLVAQPGGLPPGFAVHLVSNVSGAPYTQCEVTSQNLRSQNDRHFVGILWHNRRRFNAHYSNNIE